MKPFILVLCYLMLVTNLFAQTDTPPSALVHKVFGSVTFEGVELKTGDVISKEGLIVTNNKSFIQLKIEKWNSSISIGANSKMELNFKDEKKYTLTSGHCRWKSLIRDAVINNSKGKIFTKNASMGVRGTDFIIKSFPLFGETEIVMFEGEVTMENLENKENTVTLKKGQWGGLGGRFGKKINPPLDLPEAALNSFLTIIEAP